MKVELPLGRALRILHKKAFEVICNANEPQRLLIKKDKKKAAREWLLNDWA